MCIAKLCAFLIRLFSFYLWAELTVLPSLIRILFRFFLDFLEVDVTVNLDDFLKDFIRLRSPAAPPPRLHPWGHNASSDQPRHRHQV